MAQLTVEGVRKQFGKKTVLVDISLSVEAGSCLALLGASGSGKSTLLNLIAGFEQPDQGDIRIRGESIVSLPPHRRRVGVVFQQYALFPHLSVGENVAYPLIRSKVGATARKQRIERLLQAVKLEALWHRNVQTLSGGQQQRAAIARALAANPDILLMDEPMGALDRTLRDQLQVELKVLLREVGATVIYVTHDQREAIAVAESIAVLNSGRIEQLDATEEIYAHPRSAFVARFLWPGANSLTGEVEAASGEAQVHVRIGTHIMLGAWQNPSPERAAGMQVELIVRPEHIQISGSQEQSAHALPATVTANLFSGSHRTVQLCLDDRTELTASESSRATWKPGDRVSVSWDAIDGHLYAAPSRTEGQ